MKVCPLAAFVFAFALTAAACAQDTGSAPAAGPSAGNRPGGYGERGGRGYVAGMIGRGLMGTVTEATTDHYTIKTDQSDVYTVHLTSDTHIFKRQARMRGSGGGQGEGGEQGARRMGAGNGTPPEEIKPSDIKVGDVISVMGDTDAATKTVAARFVALMDPQTVEQIHQMEANFGKTWLMGKVTAIDGTKIILTGALDNAPHTIVADENTEFRERREPVTLADIHVGDTVRVEGALKDGVFTAASVNVAGTMGGETPAVPRNSPPQ